MIEIEGPDGVIYEFPEGTAEAEMLAAMDQVYAPSDAGPQNSVAGIAGQFGAGSQSGIAQMLGMPVDALSGALSGVGELTGLWGPIENPIGGSASIDAALSPFRAGVPEPQTGAERFTRRVGEEVGASAAGFPLAMASGAVRAAPMASAAVEGASAIGSGLGAAAADYLAPDSITAEIVGQLLGGVPAGMAASRAAGLQGSGPVMEGGTQEFQRKRASDAYNVVRNDQTRLPVGDTQGLGRALADDMQAQRMSRELTPGASAVAKALSKDLNPNTIGPQMGLRIEDLEDLRRITREAMPVTASPTDQRLATRMRDDITDFIASTGSPVADALQEGRDATRRFRAAEAVQLATDKASRRAATSGTGGNEINAMRQNLRGILDNPRKAQSFKPDELRAIEEIVMGSQGQNVLRGLSRIAPSTGALAPYLGLGGYAVAGPAMLPVLAAAEGAKALGERSTQRSIDRLIRSLLDERVVSAGSEGVDPIVRALLGARAVGQAPEEVMLDEVYTGNP